MKLFLLIGDDKLQKRKIEILEGSLQEIDKFTVNFNSRHDLFNKIIESVSDNEVIKKITNYHFSIITSKNNLLPVIFSDYKFLLNDEAKIDAKRMLMRMDRQRIYEFIEHQYTHFMDLDFTKEDEKKVQYNPIYWLYKIITKKDFNLGEYYNFFTKELVPNYRTFRELSKSVLNDKEIKELNKRCNVIADKNKIDQICLKTLKNILFSYEEDKKIKKYDVEEDNIGYKYE